MQKNTYTLTEKKLLTQDVFQLSFQTQSHLPFLPGQFITFLLPKTGFARAYSILRQEGDRFDFLIKRLENGRGGSIEICDLALGTELIGLGPMGKMVLGNMFASYLFIATGTGIVPLYALFRSLLESGSGSRIHLEFGNRFLKDTYLFDEFQAMSIKYPQFSFTYYLSQESAPGYKRGRVTEYVTHLDPKLLNSDVYVCGNPLMVDEVCDLLDRKGIPKEHIHFEKY